MDPIFLYIFIFQQKQNKKKKQEKVDGANVGVHFEQEWEPIMQKRSDLLQAKEKPQYDVFKLNTSQKKKNFFSLNKLFKN